MQTQTNIIPFPVTFVLPTYGKARAAAPEENRERPFYLKDKVRLKSDGQIGYIVDGHAKAPAPHKWCYMVHITEGKSAGVRRVAYAANLELVERVQ